MLIGKHKMSPKLSPKKSVEGAIGGPDKMSEMLALNIYYTFYGRTGWEGVGQAKAVIFFIIVGVIALIQNKLTTSKEVQQ